MHVQHIICLFSHNEFIFAFIKREKNYQGRKVGIIENGSWAPNAANVIKEILSKMKKYKIVEPIVTIKNKAFRRNRKRFIKTHRSAKKVKIKSIYKIKNK